MSTHLKILSGVAHYYENPDSYYHVWISGTLYSTALNTAAFRNILTTAFLLLHISTGFVGAWYLKARNVHRLRTSAEADRTLPLTRITPWLAPRPALKYAWDTRRLPGGFYIGIFMLLTGLFNTAHQYFVNSFILPVTMQTQCDFTQGIVTEYIGPENGALQPASTFSSANTVYNVQYQVYSYGGPFGIYKKFNADSPTFSPTKEDVLGYWNCSINSITTIAWTDWQDENSLASFLQQQSFSLFTEASYTASSIHANGTYKGFMVWSADQPDDSLILWDLTASIANNLTGAAADVTNLECQLVNLVGSWSPPILPSKRSLTDWGDRTYGFLMNKNASQFALEVEWMLNAMVMVSGSGNNDQLNISSLLTVDNSTTFGCTVQGTKIQPEIWVILSVVFLMFLFLSIGSVWLLVSQHYYRTSDAGLAEAAPASVQDWQLALLKEMKHDKTIDKKQVRDYSYGWDTENKEYVLDKTSVFQAKLGGKKVGPDSLPEEP